MNLILEDDQEAGAQPDEIQALAREAESMPWKPKTPFPVSRYLPAIEALKERGYSFAEIAEWLNGKLASKLNGTTITRAQVYHAFRFVLERNERAFQEAWQKGELDSVSVISDEEAEAKAAAADGDVPAKSKPAKTGKRTKRAKR